jgi:hypothetical protein
MRLNSTVALTLILLTLMTAAGVVSAAWGYALGREALQGVTQPDVRPASSVGESDGTPPRRDQLILLKEEDILTDVEARMNGNVGAE